LELPHSTAIDLCLNGSSKKKLSFEALLSEHGSFVQVSWGCLAAILIFVF